MSLAEAVARARETGDLSELNEVVPFMRFMGLSVERVAGERLGVMRYQERLIGNPGVPALHGGALGALLENTALLEVLVHSEAQSLPRTIDLTIDYLRPARLTDTWARARIVRRGRRVASVRVEAWQEDRQRLIATARTQLLL